MVLQSRGVDVPRALLLDELPSSSPATRFRVAHRLRLFQRRLIQHQRLQQCPRCLPSSLMGFKGFLICSPLPLTVYGSSHELLYMLNKAKNLTSTSRPLKYVLGLIIVASTRTPGTEHYSLLFCHVVILLSIEVWRRFHRTGSAARCRPREVVVLLPNPRAKCGNPANHLSKLTAPL